MRKMKTFRLLFISLFLMLPVALVENTSAQTRSDGFPAFYAKFRLAVNTRNKPALKNLLADRFIWAQDGEISRDEAFREISKIITWNKFWQSAKKAVAQNAKRCQSSECENRAGYHSVAASPYPVELLFEKDTSGNWQWSGLLGD